jgi:streptogramin lyase
MKFFSLLIIFIAMAVMAETWKNVESYNSPFGSANGLAFDGKYLWHADNLINIIKQIDPDNGRTLRTINFAGGHDPGDIAWLKGSLWVIEENKISSNPLTFKLFKVNSSSGATEELIYTIPAEFKDEVMNSQMEGITSDGRNLWLCGGGHFIFKVNPVTGEVIKALNLDWTAHPYTIDGLAFAWGHLFATINTSGMIVEIDPHTGAKLMAFKAPAGIQNGPEGLTFDGTNLWYAEYSPGNRIHKIVLKDGYYR